MAALIGEREVALRGSAYYVCPLCRSSVSELNFKVLKMCAVLPSFTEVPLRPSCANMCALTHSCLCMSECGTEFTENFFFYCFENRVVTKSTQSAQVPYCTACVESGENTPDECPLQEVSNKSVATGLAATRTKLAQQLSLADGAASSM